MATTGVTTPKFTRNPYAKPSTDKCYRCVQPGHRSNQFPKRGRKLLLAPKIVPNQRHNIFRTRCTVNKKVCDVIIDNGSSENLVSKAMVRKLGLKTEKHPSPYSIGWIRRAEAKVTEVCRIQFSIGKNYVDEITFDVVEMDACHMILGRPWKFDVDITYRGRDNIYIFMKEGKKVVLGPITDEFTKAVKTQPMEKLLFLAKGKRFLEEAKEAREIFAMVVGGQIRDEPYDI
ncbi:hypothetical protein DKX38_015367 [Salix brachista]|uniref:CCHC-type domain-containing protein n=1 Tax=Salix brachista TaxID=2182728 RepID=A0A5N5L505_9ROSI|nr:hypothetical protein DKX38_015367 [Salix brachista]